MYTYSDIMKIDTGLDEVPNIKIKNVNGKEYTLKLKTKTKLELKLIIAIGVDLNMIDVFDKKKNNVKLPVSELAPGELDKLVGILS